MTKQEALQNPKDAYEWARINGPCDETRQGACKDPHYAYCYAKDVDKCSRDDTRLAACNSPGFAYCYALNIDQCSRDDTRLSACKDSEYAYSYAQVIDKRPCNETRQAACNSPEFAYCYAKDVDKTYTRETYIAAAQDETYRDLYIKEFPDAVDNLFPLITINIGANGNTNSEHTAQEDPHKGMVQNPLTGKWSWGLF